MTVCVEWEGVVVFAFPTDGGSDWGSDEVCGQDVHDAKIQQTNRPKTTRHINTEHNPLHNTKIHRLSPTHLLLTSGLAGDSRTLASAFRRLIASWTHINYGETISVREVAREVGIVRHGIGLRPGARVLGVIGLIIGLEDTGASENLLGLGAEVRMYKSLPGGTVDRCNICCTGGGADSSGRLARKDAIEALSRVIDSRSHEVDKTISENQTIADAQDQKVENSHEIELDKIIEEVGRVALKLHPFSNSEDVDETAAERKRAAVDIWVIRAAPAKSTNDLPSVKKIRTADTTVTDESLGPVFVSLHRRLGRATMDLRCARRVCFEQLSVAAKCLIQERFRVQ